MTLLLQLNALFDEICSSEDDYITIRLQEEFAAVDIRIGDKYYSVGICVDDPDDSIVSAVREALALTPHVDAAVQNLLNNA